MRHLWWISIWRLPDIFDCCWNDPVARQAGFLASLKRLDVSFISTDNSILKQTNIPCTCARTCLFFLSENFRVLCKYKAKVAMRAMEGTVQEGIIPTWMEVIFVTTLFGQKFPKISLESEWVNKPSTLRVEQNIQALSGIEANRIFGKPDFSGSKASQIFGFKEISSSKDSQIFG